MVKNIEPEVVGIDLEFEGIDGVDDAGQGG
jgi:hypothetical protein